MIENTPDPNPIDAQGSQGFVNRPAGEVTQNYGNQGSGANSGSNWGSISTIIHNYASPGGFFIFLPILIILLITASSYQFLNQLFVTAVHIRVADTQGKSVAGAAVLLSSKDGLLSDYSDSNGSVSFHVRSTRQQARLIVETEQYEIHERQFVPALEETVEVHLKERSGDTASFIVRVVDTTNSRPVPNARILLLVEGDPLSQVTDSNGIAKYDLDFPLTGKLEAKLSVDTVDYQIDYQWVTILPNKVQDINLDPEQGTLEVSETLEGNSPLPDAGDETPSEPLPEPSTTPTESPTPTAEPTATSTNTPEPPPDPYCEVVAETLNVRSGPYVENERLGQLNRGTRLTALARNPDGQWYEVQVLSGTLRGWVNARWVACVGVDSNRLLIQDLPPPTPTSTPTLPPATPTPTESPATPTPTQPAITEWPVVSGMWASQPVNNVRLIVTEVSVIGAVRDGALFWSPTVDREFQRHIELFRARDLGATTGNFLQVCITVENNSSNEVSAGGTRSFTIDITGRQYLPGVSYGTWPHGVQVPASGSRSGCLILEDPVALPATTFSIDNTDMFAFGAGFFTVVVNEVPIPQMSL